MSTNHEHDLIAKHDIIVPIVEEAKEITKEHIETGLSNGCAEDGSKKDQPTDEERKKEEKKVSVSAAQVPFLQLFRFADKTDKLLILAGSLCAIGMGIVLPLFSLIFGTVVVV